MYAHYMFNKNLENEWFEYRLQTPLLQIQYFIIILQHNIRFIELKIPYGNLYNLFLVLPSCTILQTFANYILQKH